MDYLETFFSDNQGRILSPLEQILLMGALVKQLVKEINDDPYQPRITTDYCDEEQIISMYDLLRQTVFYRGAKKMYDFELHGFDKIPNEEGAMLLTNHATIYFGDLAPIFFGAHEKKRRAVYVLAHKIFEKSDFAKTLGFNYGKKPLGIELMEQDKLTLVCPGGQAEACKPWYRSYQVRPVMGFSKKAMGYLKIAYETNKPIIPIANIGAEETVLILKEDVKPPVEKLIRYADQTLKIGTKKFGKNLFHLLNIVKTVPLIASLPLRSKVEIFVGEPINVRNCLGNHPNQEDYWQVNLQIIKILQEMIDEKLEGRITLCSYVRKVNRFLDF